MVGWLGFISAPRAPRAQTSEPLFGAIDGPINRCVINLEFFAKNLWSLAAVGTPLEKQSLKNAQEGAAALNGAFAKVQRSEAITPQEQTLINDASGSIRKWADEIRTFSHKHAPMIEAATRDREPLLEHDMVTGARIALTTVSGAINALDTHSRELSTYEKRYNKANATAAHAR